MSYFKAKQLVSIFLERVLLFFRFFCLKYCDVTMEVPELEAYSSLLKKEVELRY